MSLPTQTSRPSIARPYQISDHEGVLRVYRAVFGEQAARELDRRWHWSQLANPFPDQSYRWTLVSGDEIVGFLATVPQRYAIGGELVVAHTPCEFMVEPGSRFHGIKLMRAFSTQCPDCVTFDDVEATIAVNTWQRIREVTAFQRYVFPLTPLTTVRFIARAALRGRRLPAPASLLRWARGTVATGTSPYEYREVDSFDARFDDLADRLAASVPAMVYRDRAFLEWRYRGDSPHRSALVTTAVSPAGALVGYSVGYVEPHGLQRGVMLDCTVLPEHREATPGLVATTSALLRSRGASSMQFYCAGHTVETMGLVLEAAGFHRFATPLKLMARLADPRLQAIALDPRSWHLKLGDTEYSHHAVQL